MKLLENQHVKPARAPDYAAIRLAVRFGCRVFAYVSPASDAGQDEFVRQCLLSGGNAMKRQSQLPMGQKGDTRQAALDSFKGVAHDGGRKAGWGIAYAPHDQPGSKTQGLAVEKSPFPAWSDTHYDQVARLAAKCQPKVLLTHLRESMWGQLQAEDQQNAHPFQLGDWAFMQHGDFPPAVNNGLEACLKAWHAQNARSPLPQGEVDSERIACYVAAKFQQHFGSDEIGPQPTEQVRQVFRQSVGEVIRWPNLTDSKKASRHRPYEGTYNLVMSDGNRIFATHYNAHTHLFVGTHRNAQGQLEYLLSTDKIQPLPTSGQQKIVWHEVPDNTLITLERTQDHQGKPGVSCLLEPLLPEGESAVYKAHPGAAGRKFPGITFEELHQIKCAGATAPGVVDESYLGKIKSLGQQLLHSVRNWYRTVLDWIKRHLLRQN
jgi:predicted glutamine amidotransferase